MRRVSLIALTLLFALLCACTPRTLPQEPLPEEPEEKTEAPETAPEAEPELELEAPPAPVYDETPAESGTAITADGADFAHVYEKGGALLVAMRDVADVLGGHWTADDVCCTVTCGGWTAYVTENGAQLRPEGRTVAGAEAVVYDGADWFVPAQALLLATGRTEFFDAEMQHLYYTSIPDSAAIAEGLRIPILMYHAVSDDMWGYWDLFVSPADMEAHLQYLQENGYTTVTFEDLPYVSAEDKPVLLTFDDGYDDNYTELFPLLQKYSAKATVFCITGSIENNHMMTQEQIRELSDSGLVSIQSHTVTHPFLGSCDAQTVAHECEQSRLDLLRITGKQPFVLCYPAGSVSNAGIETIREYYDFGVLMNGGLYVTGTDAYHVPRFYVSRGMGAQDISYYLNID